MTIILAMFAGGPMLIRPVKPWEYRRVVRDSLGTLVITHKKVYAFGSYARLYR